MVVTRIRSLRRAWAVPLVPALILSGSLAWALEPKDSSSYLAQKEFFKPELYISSSHEPLEEALGKLPNKTLWEVVSDGLDYIQVGKTEIPSRAYVSTFGFKGPDQQKRAGVLSGGERNRLNLALTLKQGGNLLLLDEPTNDLDVETLSSLENALLEFPGCAVVITHDRWFLDRIATHILAYEGTDEDPANWYWFEGNFEAYEANKIERLGPEAAKPHRSTYRKLTRD